MVVGPLIASLGASAAGAGAGAAGAGAAGAAGGSGIGAALGSAGIQAGGSMLGGLFSDPPEPKTVGGLSWMPTWMQPILAMLQAAESKRNQERAMGETLKQYHKVMGNVAGSMNRNLPKLRKTSQKGLDDKLQMTNDQAQQFYRMFHGGQRRSPGAGDYASMYGQTVPSSSPYIHGGGIPATAFDPSQSSQQLMRRAQ